MTTQISFTADEKLKELTASKAKEEGITLKTLFVYSMKAFVDGKIQLSMVGSNKEPAVEEIFFEDKNIQAKAKKLAKLLG